MNWVKNRFLRSSSTPAADPADLYAVRAWTPTDEDIELLRSMPTLDEQRKAGIKRACAAGQVVNVVDHNGELVERWVPPGVPVDPRATIAIGTPRERIVYGGRNSGKTLRARLGQP